MANVTNKCFFNKKMFRYFLIRLTAKYVRNDTIHFKPKYQSQLITLNNLQNIGYCRFRTMSQFQPPAITQVKNISTQTVFHIEITDFQTYNMLSMMNIIIFESI